MCAFVCVYIYIYLKIDRNVLFTFADHLWPRLCPGLWGVLAASHVLVLPQHDQAEALQEASHPQTVSQEEQHHAGAGQAVNVDHGALLGQEALGQSVAVRRHGQLRDRETRTVSVTKTTTTVRQSGVLVGAWRLFTPT